MFRNYIPMPSLSTHKTVLILSMHRSGTSCLAGSLQQGGMYLGDVYEHSPHNIKGNRGNQVS